MSGVNISILEGGKAENFGQVTKLRTSNGSGYDLWVPKTDVKTSHLSVKKNGLHYTNQYEPTASEKKNGKFHDIYGWDTITVSVKKKVTGKKRKTDPSTGLETDVPVTVDIDDDGNIVEKELPVRIRIVKEPSTTTYADGQSISIAGIKVKAYLHGGEEWGDVPFDELSFEPQIAQSGNSTATSDLDVSPLYKPFPFTNTSYVRYQSGSTNYNEVTLPYSMPVTAGIIHKSGGNTTGWYCAASSEPFQYVTNTISVQTGEIINTTTRDASSYKYNNKTVYVAGVTAGGVYEITPKLWDVNGETTISHQSVGWTMLYGTISGGSEQTITVSWIPDGLEEELTDTYEITVGQGPIPPNGNTGSNTGSNTGDNTGSDLGEDPDHPITPHI